MLKKFNKYTAILLLMAQLFSTQNIYANDIVKNELGVIQVNDENIYEKTKYYKDSLLGIAGGFNLVGLNSVDISPNVNGNILTNTLTYGANFGTNGVEEVSYFKKLSNDPEAINTAGHKDSILVVGSSLNVGAVDHGSSWAINGIKVNNPRKSDNPESLWQDGEREFIDLDKVEQEVSHLGSQLSKLDNKGTIINSADENNQRIQVSESELFAVYHMKANDFRFDRPISIKGFNKEQVATLIINVDMSTMDNKREFTIPKSIAHYTNGTTVKTGPVTSWSNANIIWNIYDSSNQNNQYTGAIKNTDAVTGTILSPGATVTINSDINGTVIAKDIIVGNGSTFRDDYVNLELKGITLDPDMATLRVGQTLTFAVITNPLNLILPKLNWASDNPSIASVDENGNLLARKQGKAVITVTTENGLTASSNITVQSLLEPPDINRPDLAGNGFTHPLSLTRLTMSMMVENEIGNAKLMMNFPAQDLLIDYVVDVVAKIDGTKIGSKKHDIQGGKTISIELGNLVGSNANLQRYEISIYLKMKPSSGLNIKTYNEEVDKSKLIEINNILEGEILVGENEAGIGIYEDVTLYLEPYQLQLIKIPYIN